MNALQDIAGVAGELIRRSKTANDGLMRGDVATYRSLIPLADDFVLMSPFGGRPTHGVEMTEARWEAMGRFFRNGALELEVVGAWETRDMVTLAVIERARGVEVGGLPAQDWSLRVTLVYRREGSGWRLAHRHADPLVRGVAHDAAAELAREAA